MQVMCSSCAPRVRTVICAQRNVRASCARTILARFEAATGELVKVGARLQQQHVHSPVLVHKHHTFHRAPHALLIVPASNMRSVCKLGFTMTLRVARQVANVQMSRARQSKCRDRSLCTACDAAERTCLHRKVWQDAVNKFWEGRTLLHGTTKRPL